MKPINEMQVIFNIANMRKQISGFIMDLDQLQKYDVYTMNYDQLFELQSTLIPHYNKSLK